MEGNFRGIFFKVGLRQFKKIANTAALQYTYSRENVSSIQRTGGSNTVTDLYAYGALGRLAYGEQKGNASSVLRTGQRYSTNDQPIRQNRQLDGAAHSRSFTCGSADGSLKTMAPGLGGTQAMGYDGLRRLTSVSGGSATRQYTYRDMGRPLCRWRP